MGADRSRSLLRSYKQLLVAGRGRTTWQNVATGRVSVFQWMSLDPLYKWTTVIGLSKKAHVESIWEQI